MCLNCSEDLVDPSSFIVWAWLLPVLDLPPRLSDSSSWAVSPSSLALGGPVGFDSKISSPFLTAFDRFLYFAKKSLLFAFDFKDLWLYVDLGVAIDVMLDKKPVRTEKVLPPFCERMAEALSIAWDTSSLVYDLCLKTLSVSKYDCSPSS